MADTPDRREALARTAGGMGLAALASLLGADQRVAAEPHVRPTATSGIFVFLVGGTSQVDLFDPKPELARLHGRPIPESFRAGVRLGQTNYAAPVMQSPFRFRRYGRCGMELSELLPSIGACADDLALVRSLHHEAFDHAPGELMLCTGKDQPGRPTIGSWLTYGLGSVSKDLPGYVVLLNGRSPKARSLVWGSGFLPATHQGVLLRGRGSPILDLETPQDVPPALHRAQLDAVRELNTLRRGETGDPKLDAQIAAYELAYLMQSAAPELADLSREPKRVLDSYGEGSFARSLLLARRLVERGVRFVTVTHHEWDHHERIAAGLPPACREIDRPVAALLTDLKQRGLLGSTLVACLSEFGRTAITQGKDLATAGRDHPPPRLQRAPRRRRREGRTDLRRDGRAGVEGDGRRRSRERPARDAAALLRPRPPAADVPPPGARRAADRRGRPGGDAAPGVSARRDR
ncbi:MAG TPA: DUF1501 domain-containing protein [Urbifossiella sp.]|nr:DUF1501 domain-containing protein [Urbifossiella sp.]